MLAALNCKVPPLYTVTPPVPLMTPERMTSPFEVEPMPVGVVVFKFQDPLKVIPAWLPARFRDWLVWDTMKLFETVKAEAPCATNAPPAQNASVMGPVPKEDPLLKYMMLTNRVAVELNPNCVPPL